jgi:hypothetical protein
MISIKVECGCGQHYAFDVEPAAGQMPYAVSCPVCGADGTPAANEAIAQAEAPAIPAPTPAKPAVRVVLKPKEASVAAAAPAVAVQAARVAAPVRPMPGRPPMTEADRERAIAETRSKVCWGDAYQEVVKFAMMQGFPREEAMELVNELMAERAKMLREAGIRKIMTGGGMVCLPIASWFGFNAVGFISWKLFGLTVAVGLFGGYILSRGIFMLVMPESESGDVADK